MMDIIKRVCLGAIGRCLRLQGSSLLAAAYQGYQFDYELRCIDEDTDEGHRDRPFFVG